MRLIFVKCERIISCREPWQSLRVSREKSEKLAALVARDAGIA
jgi:hypothetical protein